MFKPNSDGKKFFSVATTALATPIATNYLSLIEILLEAKRVLSFLKGD